MSGYDIRRELSRVRSTIKTGAMQRSGVARYYIYRDGLRLVLPRSAGALGDGGFRSAVQAQSWIDSRGVTA
jgi:hypothetical protein